MKYNFKKLIVKDIEGKELPISKELYKTIAKLLYNQCHKNLEVVEIARDIYKGKEVEIDKVQIEEVKNILLGPQSFQSAAVKKYVKDYIESVQVKK